MKRINFLCIALLLLVLAAPCSARQFVVDGSNLHATDTNPGTAALPFKTIQHAADVARAGDIVLIRPGVYAESVSVRHSGTAEHPIVFQATTWHGVTVVAPDAHTYSLFEPATSLDGRTSYYVTLRGIVFGPAPFRGWTGGNDYPNGIGVARGWRVEDCVVRKCGGVGFGVWNSGDSDGFTLLRTIFEGCYEGGAGGAGNGDKDELTNARVIDCIFRRNNPEGLDPGGYNGANKFLFIKHFLMDGVISYDNNGSGTWFDTGAVDFAVKNCTFFGNHAGYERNLDGSPIGADESDCGSGFFCEANPGPGLFENNVLYSNLGDGLQDNDSGSKGLITIRNNQFVDNHGRGLVFRGMADMNADYGNVDRKTGANLITFAPIGAGGSYGSWASDDRTVSWSGGTPTPQVAHDHGYIWQNADAHAVPNSGWKITAPADSSPRTLFLYAGGNGAQITLTAHLSDSSAPDYTTTQTYAGGGLNLYSISYRAASAGQTLSVAYVKSANAGNSANGSADIVGVWLSAGGRSGDGIAGSVSDASSFYDLSALGTLDWLHPGRVSYGGDRLLGPALVTDNVFKDNGQPWGTTVEEHVLGSPRAMGIVIDDNVYEIPATDTGAWGWWKPTDSAGIAATGLSELRTRLGVEQHGRVERVAFRGPLIDVYTYPTKQDALDPDPKKLQEVPSAGAERLSIDRAIAKAGGLGHEAAIPVFGHTPIGRVGSHFECQVYDLQARYVTLILPDSAAKTRLEHETTSYAIISPTYLQVKVTRDTPYDVAATFIR